MNTEHIDWQWTAVLLLGAGLLAHWSTFGAALALAGAAYLVLRAGYLDWSHGPIRGRRVRETYWRGRRIDLERRDDGAWTMPTRPPLQTVLCLVLGTGLAAIAASMVLEAIGRG